MLFSVTSSPDLVVGSDAFSVRVYLTVKRNAIRLKYQVCEFIMWSECRILQIFALRLSWHIKQCSHQPKILTSRRYKIDLNYWAVQITCQMSKFSSRATSIGSAQSLYKTANPCLPQLENDKWCYYISLPLLHCQYTHFKHISGSADQSGCAISDIHNVTIVHSQWV